MQPDVREDVLEAILNMKVKGISPISLPEIAATLQEEPSRLEEVLQELEKEGSVSKRADGILELTQKGSEIAERVCRKHRVLECFLSEMLGVDGRAASRQACQLEHTVSDETIDKITSLFGTRRRRRGAGKGALEKRGIRSLLAFDEGDEVTVSMIQGARRLDRLAALGILPGARLLLRRKLPNDAIVVQVKECDIALSPEIASSIFAEKSR